MRKAVSAVILAALLLVVLAVCAGCATPAHAQVKITNAGFTPAKVTIRAGGSVTWTNDTTNGHTVTDVQGDFDSQAIESHQTFTKRFDKAGTIRYYCRYHPSETGEVVVR